VPTKFIVKYAKAASLLRLFPELAVEVLSESNTHSERKCHATEAKTERAVSCPDGVSFSCRFDTIIFS
jgi:hypothetical protein